MTFAPLNALSAPDGATRVIPETTPPIVASVVALFPNWSRVAVTTTL